jgi:hypothetical protein
MLNESYEQNPKIPSMKLPAASCRLSKLILLYPLTLTLSTGRGN